MIVHIQVHVWLGGELACDNDGFGLVKYVSQFLVPEEGCARFEGCTEWLHANGSAKCIRYLVNEAKPRSYVREVDQCWKVADGI